jgi:hypothetical protein
MIARTLQNALPWLESITLIDYGRETFTRKAALCLRLADGLSLSNPGRLQLMDIAQDFRKRARELEAQATQERQSNDAD